MTTPPTSTIKKLNTMNYHSWKFKMELVLIKKDLWTVMTGEDPQPTTSIKGKETESGESSKAAAMATKTPTEWKRIDQRARATICLAVNDSELTHVRSCKTSSDVWNKIA